jgi:uncharacterized damage-inducible protein DinB
MTPEQAKAFLEGLAPDLDAEFETTRKVLAAMPEGKGDYTPHPTSRTAWDLGTHLASTEVWFLEGLLAGEFSQNFTQVPDTVKSVADLVAWYETAYPPLLARTKALSGEHLAKPLSFFGVVERPAVTYLSWLLLHSAHHRGQLSTYLRPMGGTVPSIYGGSADEPFVAPS